jgi:hypothetical protein
MRGKSIFCFILLWHPHTSFSSSHSNPSSSFITLPPFFSSSLTTNVYFGQDLDIGAPEPFDPYSLFQYIFDFGIDIEKQPIRTTPQTISIVAKGRMKGLLGDKGSGRFPLQEEKKFQIWMREAFLHYFPTSQETIFLQAGIFPFKLGNGFVLGDAYTINIPISWQYIYEQIDQFRPAILLHVGNQKKSLSVDSYVGFIQEENKFENALSPTLNQLLIPFLENLNSSFTQEGTHDIVAAFQVNIGSFDSHNFCISPYFFFQKNNQFVETPNDATSTLYTPGIYAFFKHKDTRFSFEGAKNFGHQHVNALDRNLISSETGHTNRTISLSQTATELASSFKNSYDQFRKSYKNSYAGYMAYADVVVTKKHLTWALAALYTSGGNNPNDSYDTLLMTRLTPGVQYQDYNKKYKGFIGTNQYYDVNYINPLYYGTGDFNYTNLAFVGTTLEYSTKDEKNPLTAQCTLVTYVKPTALVFNVTNLQGKTMDTPLARYLGTELNYSATYTYNSHLTFSLLGGIFFPGSFYKASKSQIALLETDLINAFPSLTPAQTNTNNSKVKTPFFVGFSLVGSFDSSGNKEIFPS